MADSIEKVAEDHGVERRNLTPGLDSLRFVTAIWVAFSHGARFPIDRIIQPDSLPHKALLALGKTMFNGTAAVAVFFLISGLLIHGANVGRRSVAILPFWTRRGVRIGLPLLTILAIAHLLGPAYEVSLNEVLWSVIAEIVYYALYPLALPFIARFGIGRILAVSLVISLVMIGTHADRVYLWSFGAWTWLFCAPLWLMGCFLAEHRQMVSTAVARVSVWWFRASAIVYCFASTVLATHAGKIVIGYTWTIWAFGAFCIFWLASEMCHASISRPQPLLERLGLAGYSIYLTHKLPL